MDRIRIIKFKEISGFAKKSSFLKNNTPKVIPKTKAIFATLEPMTLPTTITALLSKAAKRLVNISGADVPNAITVDPIRKGDIPYLDADKTEYFSSFCALIQTRAVPEKIYRKVRVVTSKALKE